MNNPISSCPYCGGETENDDGICDCCHEMLDANPNAFVMMGPENCPKE